MKLKHKLLLFVPILTGLIWSCQKEYVIPGPEANSPYITTSFGNTEARVQINGIMSFIDLSPGVVSRQWTFPEVAKDKEAKPLVNSTEDVVKVSFTTPGVYKVKLSQVFKGKVWVGNQQKDVATFDTLLNVTVLDSVRARFTAQRLNDGTLLKTTNDAQNEIIAGKNVKFTQTSTGEPNNFSWVLTRKDGFTINLSGAEPSSKFSSVGVYDLKLIVSSTFGKSTLEYKNFIKVVPSTEPLDIVSAVAKADKVEIEFSRDIENPVLLKPTTLSFNVKNGSKVVNVKALRFSFKQGFANILVVDLDGPIYNSDEITMTYNDAIGKIISADGKPAELFKDKTVQTYKPNVLESAGFDFSFENSTNENWVYAWWGGVWGKYKLDVASEKVRTGTKSGRLVMEPNGGAIFLHKNKGADATFPVTAGKTYEIGCWVYVESLGANKATTADPDLRFYWSPNTDWGVGAVATFSKDFVVGKWVYTKTQVKFSATGKYSFMIRGFNENNTAALKVHLDDISLSEVETRP